MMKGLDGIEQIADTVRSDIVPLGRVALEKGIEASDTTKHILTTLHQRVCDAVQQATTAIGDIDQNKALEVINMKAEIKGLIADALHYQAERVAPTTTPDLIAAFRMEDEFIDALWRIYRMSRRLSKLMLPAVVSSKEA
jgi:Na+/phosphate symporter